MPVTSLRIFVAFIAVGCSYFYTNFAWAATPVISNISGTVSSGQILTVIGSNLEQENMASWLPFFSQNPTSFGFEGSDPASDGYSFVTSGNGSIAEYQSAIKLSGSKAARFHVQGDYCCGGYPNEYGASGNVYVGTPNTTGFWARHYVRTHLNGGRWSDAGKNSWYGTSGGSPFVFTLRPQGNDIWMWRANGDLVSLPYSSYEHDRWYCIEEKVSGGKNGTYELYVDGKLLKVVTPTDGGNVSAPWYEFGLVNGWNDSSNPNMNMDSYLDNYVISSSRIFPSSVIEITNSADYSTATKMYQAPVSLSDTLVQVKVDLTGLGSGPLYLFVTNNRQERSSAYLLSSGSGSDTTSPTSPTNLAANATSSSSITVSWNPATDDVGVSNYQVERCLGLSCSNFAQVGTPTDSPFVDSNLTASTGYSYHVRAVDAAGNTSGWSNVVSTTTQGSPTFSSCSTVTPTNFTDPTFTGYGAPYDVFASNTPLISTQCSSTDTHTLTATLGIPGDTTRIVYTKGYYYDPGINDWTSFTGTCTGALNGEWCQGSVSASVTNANISTASVSDPSYLVGFTCRSQNGSWKCGCRDTACANFYWQVQGGGM